MDTFCPQCGFGVKIDEDGCCIHCGATAIGEAVDELFTSQQADAVDVIECGSDCHWTDKYGLVHEVDCPNG